MEEVSVAMEGLNPTTTQLETQQGYSVNFIL